MYYLFLGKRWVEDLLMLPLIWLGRLIAVFKPLDEPYDYFFFFPCYAIGGAEKVHAQITQALAGHKGIIFFTRKSKDDRFLGFFKKSGFKIKDISKYTGSKRAYPLNIVYRGIISGYIRHQKKAPVVFNGQCNFGYKLSPWLGKNIPQAELIHSFNSFAWIRVPFLPFYTKQIMISHQTVKDYQAQYKQLSVPEKIGAAIAYIQNGIELPQVVEDKKTDGDMIVLYVGRGTAEKRVHLIAQAAQKLKYAGVPVQVQLVGDVGGAIPPALHKYVHLLGPVSDPAVLAKLYAQAHVLVLSSAYEGFPMVVMEAMAQGLAIVSTNVGDMAYHVKDGVNGFLVDAVKEHNVVAQITAAVQKMASDKETFLAMSSANRAYALKHFGMDAFNNAYLRLFQSLQHD